MNGVIARGEAENYGGLWIWRMVWLKRETSMVSLCLFVTKRPTLRGKCLVLVFFS